MNRQWASEAFEAIIEDVSGGNVKIQQSDYLSTGLYPIVDQGKDLIGGHTNDEHALFKGELPVVIFGGHTCCFKYVDFPFCLGADGVKVLKPKKDINSKFIYYYLSFQRLPDTGYDLHYKYLKRLLLKYPSNISEQLRIVEQLDLSENLLKKRRQSITKLDQLTQAVYYDMFGTPKSSWKEVKVESLAADVPVAMRSGPFGSDLKHSEFVDAGVAVLGIDNAVHNEFRWDRRRFITLEKYQELKRYTVRPGDVLITIMATLGRTCVVPDDIPLAINTKHLAALTVDQNKILPEFLSITFLLHRDILAQLKMSEKGAIMGGLNLGIIKNLKFKLPPIELQKEFVDKLIQIKKLHKKLFASSSDLNKLQQSLMSSFFN